MSFISEQLTRHARRVGEVGGILAKSMDSPIGSPIPTFELPKKFLVSSDGDRLTEYTRPERIRMAVSELGTTYIKLGQMLSTRGDLIGWDIADELSKTPGRRAR